jgi:hypothetical protein
MQHPSPTYSAHTALLQEFNPMCSPPLLYSSAEVAGPLALHSRLPQQSHPNLPTRLPFNKRSPSAWPNPVIKEGPNDSPRTLQPSPRAIHDSHWTSGKCGPRTDQSFLADVRWQTTPSPRSLSGLIATQSDLKRATTLKPPIAP